MHLERLKLTNLRTVSATDLSLSSQINLIHGPNGSGKTSVLEGIHLLALGRSFRSHQLKHVIRFGEAQVTCFGILQSASDDRSGPVGVERTMSGDFRARFQGQDVDLAELASLIPLQLIDAQSFDLLDGAPAYRRQFLDWGCFHQSDRFINAWRRFQRALKQRNSLLKHGKITPAERVLWDQELANHAELLSELRELYLERLEPGFERIIGALTTLPDIRLSLARGWDRDRPYLEILNEQFERDLAQGYTSAGPQRADIRVKVEGRPAAEHLSRGQKKLVVSALKLAQGALYAEMHQQGCLFLIDDLPAELDERHLERFCDFLRGSGNQIFITCVDPDAIRRFWPSGSEGRMFQLEAGSLVATRGFGESE